jgi:Rho GTPase-activating protein 1
MDDYNLAIVLTPNLTKGSNPIRDVAMCAVAGAPALGSRNSPTTTAAEGKTTLGSIIALCIRRYYEIFDEIPDRGDAAGSTLVSQSHSHSSFLSSQQLSPAPSEASYVIQDEDEEEYDDEDYGTHAEAGAAAHGHRSRRSVQLSQQQQQQQNLQFGGASPPSAWSAAGAGSNGKRHRTTPSGGTSSSGVKSMHTVLGESSTTTGGVGTHGRAKSVISIDKGSGQGHRKGTISIGRGTTRKSAGSGVEAIGITAEGFFADPKEAPPVPPRSSKPGSP